MPALPSVPNVLRCALKYALAGNLDILNIFHCAYTGSAPTDAELITLAGVVAGNWAAHLGTQLVEDLTLTGVSLTDLTSPTSAAVDVPFGVTGGMSGEGVPNGSAAVVSRHIARRYRGGHSRVYIPGAPIGELLTEMKWQTAWLTNVQDDWALLEGSIPGNLWSGATSGTPCSVSYYEGFTPHLYPSGRYRNVPNLRGTPLVDPVTLYQANPKCASQRRRNLQSS